MVCAVACSPSVRIRGDAAACQSGRQGEQERESAHRAQRDQPEEAAVRAEEDGDRHDRQELADRAGREHVGPEATTEHVVVAQDRQQGAQGGGGQRERHRDERAHQPGDLEQPDDGAGQRDRHHPAHEGEAAGPLPEQARAPARSPPAGTGSRDRRWRAARCSPAPPSRAPAGPMTMPPTISTTTWGTRRPGEQADDERRERGDQRDHEEAGQPLAEIVRTSSSAQSEPVRAPGRRADRRRRWSRRPGRAGSSGAPRCPAAGAAGAASASASYAASSRRAICGDDAP